MRQRYQVGQVLRDLERVHKVVILSLAASPPSNMQEVYRVKPLGHQNEHEYITEERRLELIPTIEEIRSMGYDIVQGKQLVHQVVHQEFGI